MCYTTLTPNKAYRREGSTSPRYFTFLFFLIFFLNIFFIFLFFLDGVCVVVVICCIFWGYFALWGGFMGEGGIFTCLRDRKCLKTAYFDCVCMGR